MTEIANPTLSVVIPTFNSAEGVERLVRDSPCVGIEICVHGDGSSDTLTGGHVAATFEADTLASALAEAIRIGEDQSDVYRQAVAARSVDRYLDVILGETPA